MNGVGVIRHPRQLGSDWPELDAPALPEPETATPLEATDAERATIVARARMAALERREPLGVEADRHGWLPGEPL